MTRCDTRFALCFIAPIVSLVFASQASADIMPPPATRHHDTVCNARYLPVCGDLDGKLKTYSNACEARNAGAKVVADGECGQNGSRR